MSELGGFVVITDTTDLDRQLEDARRAAAEGDYNAAVGSLSAHLESIVNSIRTGARRFKTGTSPDQMNYVIELCRKHDPDCKADMFLSEAIRETDLEPFSLDSRLVTNQEFRVFVESESYQTTAEQTGSAIALEDGNFVRKTGLNWRSTVEFYLSESEWEQAPVTLVSFYDAQSYCESIGARLPTEAEWEYSARTPERLQFVWGSEWVQPDYFSNLSQVKAPPVQQLEGPDGFAGLFGSVWTWVDTQSGDQYTLKGASFFERNPAFLRAAAHRWDDPNLAYSDNGIRCARTTSEWDL